MPVESKFIKIFKKEPKKICITLGGIYAGFGVFAIFMMTIQKLIMKNVSPPPDENFTLLMTKNFETWSIFMPLLILLGLIYIGFGLSFNKIKTNKFRINQLITLLSLGWVTGYTISSFEYLRLFSNTTSQGFESFGVITYIFAGFGFLFMFVMFTVPQYLIGKKIKNSEAEERTKTL